MAKTAVVNPRRRRRRATKRRRRRNYGASASTANPRRRRRRRSYGAAPRRRARRRRRRNPSVYSSGGYRKTNPKFFDIDALMHEMPAATGGLWFARWAAKMAGPMEEGDDKNEPGIKHAIAIYLAASFGGQIVGQVLGDSRKGDIARIGALAWGGDLFLRKRFMKDNKWIGKNLNLEGVDDPDDVWDYEGEEGEDQEMLQGFESTSALGDTYTDAVGNRYQMTPQGWALAGMGEMVEDEYGNVYELGAVGADYPGDYNALMEDASGFGGYSPGPMAGFQTTTALGFRAARANPGSSFGYA